MWDKITGICKEDVRAIGNAVFEIAVQAYHSPESRDEATDAYDLFSRCLDHDPARALHVYVMQVWTMAFLGARRGELDRKAVHMVIEALKVAHAAGCLRHRSRLLTQGMGKLEAEEVLARVWGPVTVGMATTRENLIRRASELMGQQFAEAIAAI